MKKYITMDFDDKGKPVLGGAKDRPNSNSFIPTTWTPPAPVSEGSGLKSISISPVIETTPALADISPYYYDDEHRILTIYASFENNAEYTITVTPTPDWYVYTDDDSGEVGEPLEIALTTDEDGNITAGSQFGVSSQDDEEYIEITIHNGAQ